MKNAFTAFLIFYGMISVIGMACGTVDAMINKESCDRKYGYPYATRLRLLVPAYETGCWLGTRPGLK